MSTSQGNDVVRLLPPDDAPGSLQRVALAALAGVFVALAVTSAILVPWDASHGPLRERTPPDEAAHFAYVEHLATKRSLPVFDSAHGDYESHQPPLYYALSVIPYTAAAWAGTRAAYIAVRLFSVAIGACLVYLIWVFMRRLFPQALDLPLVATAMAALLPMHVAVLSAITNDGLAELVATAILYVCLTGLLSGFTNRRVLATGALLGLGALVKTGCLLLAPVVLLAMVLRMHQTRYDFRRLLRQWALCFAACMVICGWWLVRNTKLYGDPFAVDIFRDIFLARGAERATPQMFFDWGMSLPMYVVMVALWTWCSFWGVLGQANQFMPAWFYLMGGVLTMCTTAGCARLWWCSRRGESGMDVTQRQMLLLFALALAVALIAFVKFNADFFQAQARYLFTAIAPIVCFSALGWRELVPRRMRPYALAAVIVCMLGMSVCALVPGLASNTLPWER